MDRRRKRKGLRPFGKAAKNPNVGRKTAKEKWRTRPTGYSYINKRRVMAALHVAGITRADLGREMGRSVEAIERLYLGQDRWPDNHWGALEDTLDLPASWFRNPKPPKLVID